MQGGPQKSKPLPNDQKILINGIKACQFDYMCITANDKEI